MRFARWGEHPQNGFMPDPEPMDAEKSIRDFSLAWAGSVLRLRVPGH